MERTADNVHRLHTSTERGNDPLIEEIERLKSQVEVLACKVENKSIGTLAASSIRAMLAARSRRNQFFDPFLFADPAWDILLELYASELEQRRISVTKLCYAAGVPMTTALRWISKLDDEGLVIRQDDPLDARRIWINLSPAGFSAMQNYLETVPRGALCV